MSSTALAVGLASASFAAIGAASTLPGALLPLLLERFGMRPVEAGSMLAFQPIAYLLAVLGSGRLLEQLPPRRVLSAAVFTFAAGIAGFGLISNPFAGAAMLFVSGIGFGVMEVGINTILIRVGGARSSNLLNFAHLFFGVGCFVTPALATHAVAAGVSWRLPFLLTGGATALVSAGWMRLRLANESMPAAAAGEARLRPAPVTVLAMLLGVYVGVEVGVGTWLTKYLVTARGATLASAGTALSLYWLGLAAGRLALSVFAHRIREETLLLVLTIAATASLAGTLLAGSAASATVIFAIAGAGLSGIFPATIALGGRHHPHNAARATSLLVAGAGVGGIAIPWTMSAVSDAAGVIAGMAFYAAAAATMIVLAALLFRFPRPLYTAANAISS